MTDTALRRAIYGGPDVVRSDPKRKTKHGATRKKAVRNADKYASLDVRLDAKCVICEATAGKVETVTYTVHDYSTDTDVQYDKVVSHGNIVCGHLFSRIAYSTRWDQRNLYCLCSHCNMGMENDPVIAEKLLRYAESLWGVEGIEELHQLYALARQVLTYEIQDWAVHWKSKWEKHKAWKGGAR